MIEQKTWREFKESGLLWWINMILHTFGWAICFEMDGEKITNVYPARVKFRGFDEKTNTEGYIKISKYIQQNADQLLKESQE